MPQTSLLDYFKAPMAAPLSPSGVLQATGEAKLPRIAHALNALAASTWPNDPGGGAEAPPPVLLPSPNLADNHGEKSTEDGLVPKFSEVAIIPVQRPHLPAIQQLTSTLLPVRYPDKFFSGTVDEILPAMFSRVALSMSKPIGWIRCRLDPFPEPTSPPSNTRPIYNQIYIQALCLLAPYRGQGVATALLESILEPRLLLEHDVALIYAHVWECNTDALEWYSKRGFKQVVMVDNYYRKLRPGGAWIIKKDLR